MSTLGLIKKTTREPESNMSDNPFNQRGLYRRLELTLKDWRRGEIEVRRWANKMSDLRKWEGKKTVDSGGNVMWEREERGMRRRRRYERTGGNRGEKTAWGGGEEEEKASRWGWTWYIAVIHFRAFKCWPYFLSDKKIEIIQQGPYLSVGAESVCALCNTAHTCVSFHICMCALTQVFVYGEHLFHNSYFLCVLCACICVILLSVWQLIWVLENDDTFANEGNGSTS